MLGVPGVMSRPEEHRPVGFPDVPDEEGLDEADAARRLDDDPDEQPNRTEREPRHDLDGRPIPDVDEDPEA